jgi:hypothetical protein
MAEGRLGIGAIADGRGGVGGLVGATGFGLCSAAASGILSIVGTVNVPPHSGHAPSMP